MILEREAALEQALRESEERYRALAMATNQVVWRCDAAGNNIWVSETWQRLSGWESEKAKGSGWLEFVHPGDRARVEQIWRESLQAGREYHGEFRMRMRDGSCRYFESRGVPVRNPDGSLREWIGANVDITDRKRVEQELRASEHRRLMALSAARVGGFVWDPCTGESELSSELQEIFGFEPTDTAGGMHLQKWLGNVHADDRAMKAWRACVPARTSGSMDFEYRYHHPQLGLRWLYVKGQLRPDEAAGNGKGASEKASHAKKAYGVVLDITERKKRRSRAQAGARGARGPRPSANG